MARSLLPDSALSTARRVVVAVIGGTLLLVGVVLLVTPGPGIVVLGLGLAVLAAEFAWARRWLRKLKTLATSSEPEPGEGAGRPQSDAVPEDGKAHPRSSESPGK